MTKPARRLRLVKYLVQPVLVADDGATLTDCQTGPVGVPAGGLAAWEADDWPALLANLQAQLDKDTPR